jgi:UDP-N-acetylmuramate dehydrogenase
MKDNIITILDNLNIEYKIDHSLANYTTWKVGGNAEIFCDISDNDKIIALIKNLVRNKLEYTIIGGGSNVLISDNGIKGLVIRNRCIKIDIKDNNNSNNIKEPIDSIKPRLIQVDKKNYYAFDELNYAEDSFPNIEVEILSGTPLSYSINNLINKGVTGLQWFAGIPGTIGGAIYNNIHGGTHYFSEYIISVKVINSEGEIEELQNNTLEFDYDYSRFHKTNEYIVSAKLRLYKGDKVRAKNTSILWATKKKLQPHNSAGCTFQNISDKDKISLNLESNSWGYIIDNILGLKGYTIGGASISHHHAAFIETNKSATAQDVYDLIAHVRKKSLEKLNITPKLEIFLLGFTQKEQKDLT